MKDLERIKLEVFATEIWTEHEDLDEVMNEVAKRYAKEVAMQALKNASESARVMAEDTVTGNKLEVASWTDCDNFKFSISKTSILKEENIPEF